MFKQAVPLFPFASKDLQFQDISAFFDGVCSFPDNAVDMFSHQPLILLRNHLLVLLTECLDRQTL